MIRHAVVVPLLFLLLAVFVGFIEHGAPGLPQNNLLHDMVGAKSLAGADIKFDRILTARSVEVTFCQQGAKYVFRGSDKSSTLLERDFPGCKTIFAEDGAALNHGSGKLFAEIFDVMREKAGE